MYKNTATGNCGFFCKGMYFLFCFKFITCVWNDRIICIQTGKARVIYLFSNKKSLITKQKKPRSETTALRNTTYWIATHPVDVLLEGSADLALFLSDHPLQLVKLLQPELDGPSPATQEGLSGLPQRLLLHADVRGSADSSVCLERKVIKAL